MNIFHNMQGQPLLPSRMLVMVLGYVRYHWRVLGRILLSVYVLSFLILIFGILAGLVVFGQNFAFMFVIWIAVMIALAANLAVNVQRFILIGERPKGIFGFRFGRREMRFLAYWLWLGVIMAFGYALAFVIALKGFGDGHNFSKAQLWFVLLSGWVCGAVLNIHQLFYLPRAALDHEDATVGRGLIRMLVNRELDANITKLFRGNWWRLAKTWLLVGVVVNPVVYLLLWLGYWFQKNDSGAFAMVGAVMFVWFLFVATFHIVNTLLFLRLGGAVEDPQNEGESEQAEP